MKTRTACILILLATCLAAQARDDAQIKKIAKKQVDEINQALMKGDAGKIVDLTYPKVIEMAGGREKMIKALEADLKDMKSKGIEFRSVKVDNPSDPVASGKDLYVVVTFLLEMKIPEGKLRSESFVIGVSSDQGNTWTFLNAGNQDVKTIKKILPGLPEKLELPKKQSPVFEKE